MEGGRCEGVEVGVKNPCVALERLVQAKVSEPLPSRVRSKGECRCRDPAVSHRAREGSAASSAMLTAATRSHLG